MSTTNLYRRVARGELTPEEATKIMLLDATFESAVFYRRLYVLAVLTGLVGVVFLGGHMRGLW